MAWYLGTGNLFLNFAITLFVKMSCVGYNSVLLFICEVDFCPYFDLSLRLCVFIRNRNFVHIAMSFL